MLRIPGCKFLSVFLIAAHAVSFSAPSAHAEDITVQDGSVNDWQHFNVNEGEHTSITVVDANGNPMVDGRAVINVLQDFASRIDGNLDISGIIAFFNSHGFDIGPNADVNVVGGLILSTLKISEAEFFAGMAALNQGLNDPGFISNEGHINVDPGSFLALVAGAIKNAGTIAAEGGTVVLAAGNQGLLTIGGDGLVSVKITEPVSAEVFDFNGNKVADQIDNSGTIAADGGGLVKLTAQGAEEVFDNIINHSGIISATSIVERNGQVILEGGDEGVVNVTGTIDVSGKDAGETGGMVHVLGHHVGLFDEAVIDASGDAGGGTVLIGGDYKGSNPEIHNAEAAYVGAGVSINASALQTGDGGKMIVWGNESNQTHGSLLAKGGALSGDGGFIETSAHYLDVGGIRVSTAAMNGANGQWLLDPYNLTISSGADNNITGTTPFEPSGASSILNITTLQTALDNGDVTIETGNDGGAGNGDITVNADLSVGNILTLTAYGSVILNNDISGAGDVVITSQHGNITQNSGTMTGTGGMVFTASEGDISLTSAGNDIARMDFTGINVTVTDTNGIELGSGQTTNAFSLTTTGAVTQSSYLTVGGTATLAAGSGNNITLNNSSNNFSTVGITSGNNVALRDAGALILGASTVSGTLNVTTAGAITQSGALAVTGTTTLAAGTGNDITLNNASNNFSTVTITSARNVSLRDTNALVVNGTVSGTSLDIVTNGTLTDGGILSAHNAVTTLTAGSGNDISLNNGFNGFASVGIVSGRNVTLRDISSGIVMRDSTVSGTLTLNVANGANTQTGAITANALSLNVAGGQSLTFDNASNSFNSVSIAQGGTFALRNSGALAFGTSTLSGNLNVTAGGAVTQTGVMSITGTTTIAAGTGNNITLNNASNNFGTVAVTSGNNVTLRDTNSIGVGVSNAAGAFSLTAGGAITGAGTITAGAASSLTAGTTIGTSAVPLDVAITGALTLSGTNAYLSGTAVSFNSTGLSGSLIFPNAAAADTSDSIIQTTAQVAGTEIAKITPSQFDKQNNTKKNDDPNSSSLNSFYFSGGSDSLPGGSQLIDTSSLEGDYKPAGLQTL